MGKRGPGGDAAARSYKTLGVCGVPRPRCQEMRDSRTEGREGRGEHFPREWHARLRLLLYAPQVPAAGGAPSAGGWRSARRTWSGACALILPPLGARERQPRPGPPSSLSSRPSPGAPGRPGEGRGEDAADCTNHLASGDAGTREDGVSPPRLCLQGVTPASESKVRIFIEASPLRTSPSPSPPLCALVRADGKGRREEKEKEAGRS